MNKNTVGPSNFQPVESAAAAENDAQDSLPQESEAIERCQRGDSAAFDQLVTRYRQRAFSMIYQMVRNEEDAWDLAQDGFLKAWRNIRHFRGQSQFYTWLYRVMMNVTIDWLRRRQIKGEQAFDDAVRLQDIEPASSTTPQREAAPAVRLSDKEIRARIDEAILRLSPEHREVIVLREIDGLEYQEIADRVGIPLGSVMSRLFYGRKKLQSLLRDVYESL